MRPEKMPFKEEIAAEHGSREVAPFTAPMFESLKLPINRRKRFVKILKFFDEN